MHHRTLVHRSLAVVTLLLAAHTARADDKPAAGGPPAAPKPAAELAAIKAMAGNWTCQGVMPAGAMGPGSPEQKYQSTFKVVPIYEGFAYNLTYEQKKSKTHPVHLLGSWSAGWDATKKKLVFFWLDNMGSVGTQTTTDWVGNDLVLAGEGSFMGHPTSLRDTLTRDGDKKLHWKGEMKPAGAPGWIVIGEDDCKK